MQNFESIFINNTWLKPEERYELYAKRGRGKRFAKEVLLIFCERTDKKAVHHYRWYGVFLRSEKGSKVTKLQKITQNKWDAEWKPRLDPLDGDLISDPSSLESKRLDMKCSLYTKLVKRPADKNLKYLDDLRKSQRYLELNRKCGLAK